VIFICSTSRPLPVIVHTLLFHGARHIYGTTESDSYDLIHDLFEGRVSYQGKSACMGCISGPLFDGVLEIGDTTIRCSFVVRRSSMPEVQRMGAVCIPMVGKYPTPRRFLEHVPGDASVN